MRSSNVQRADELRRVIARAEAQLANLSVIPDRDEYEDGTVLRVVVRYAPADAESYTYLLFKVATGPSSADRWYHTGSIHSERSLTRSPGILYGWDQVREWLHSVAEVVSLDVMVPVTDRDRREAALTTEWLESRRRRDPNEE